MKLELWYPLKTFVITQEFGTKRNVQWYHDHGVNIIGHNGIDYVSPNVNIRATHDGIVTFTGEDGAGGLGVVVRTMEPFDYDGGPTFYKTIYWHCAKDSFKVKPGDCVLVGDILAEQDNTGLSTGKHLHFGLKPIEKGEYEWQWSNIEEGNGYYGAIDPAPFFNGHWAGESKIMLALIEKLKTLIAQLFKGR